MILADKFTCEVPAEGNTFLECTLPGTGIAETGTMWATVAAVVVSLGIAIFGPIAAEKRVKKKAELRSWNESAKLYVEAVRALSTSYPKVSREVDDRHYLAFNHYAALRVIPQKHPFAKAVDNVNVSIERFLEVWVRTTPLVKIPPGVLLAGTASMRDYWSAQVQNILRDYCKLIIQWHFQPGNLHSEDLVGQIEKIRNRLDSRFEFISKDYIEAKAEHRSEKVRKAKRGL